MECKILKQPIYDTDIIIKHNSINALSETLKNHIKWTTPKPKMAKP